MGRERLILALLLLLPGLAGSGDAPDNAALRKNQVELARVVATLKAEQTALEKTRGEEKSILGDLETLDRKLERVGRQKERLSGQAVTLHKEIGRHEKRVEEQRHALKQEQKRLGAHMRLVYGLGEQGILKVALTQATPGRMQQGMQYFGYFVKARQDQFDDFRQRMLGLAATIREKQSVMDTVRGVERNLLVEEEEDRQQRQERAALLAKVREQAGLHERKVRELTVVQKELEGFITRLEEELKNAQLAEPVPPPEEERKYQEVKPSFKSVKPVDDTNMRANRGRLPPPVSASWRAKEPGLFFNVQQNNVVGAIYRGQVVFADWFKGYGLLVIVNHGSHIFSLYGHNQKLLVAQGSWVETGERIAESGDTGSLDGPGLYFEIRQEGRAVDAERWLAGQMSDTR